MQVIDFAGGLSVHLVGGVSSFTAALIVGPRFDRFVINEETGLMEDRKEPGHSVVFALLGTFIVWFAFFGFNSYVPDCLQRALSVDGRILACSF
jgi:Amt family ammonium transporter